MAISAISPIANPPVLIQALAQARQVNLQQPFEAALTNTLTSLAGAPAALQAASTQSQLVNTLEQALFNQWVSSLQSASADTLGTSLDSLLAGSLGVIGTTGNGVSNLPFDTSSPQSLLFSARLVSLFNTVDLLGGDTGQGSSFGSLLDVLA
jgi:putative component of toxin-antitoxin plasmid stabilization module